VTRTFHTPTSKSYCYAGVPGLVSRRRAKATGATIALYNNAQAGFPESDRARWTTCCETHSQSAPYQSLAEAKDMASSPEFWCSGCGGTGDSTVPARL
jgi:hypothetical protein